jgi:hypothetical protein
MAALLSDRPQIFSEPAIRERLNYDEVCAVLKRAALESIANRDVDAEREFAALCYADLADDFAWYGAVAFDFALSYLLRTLDSKIKKGRSFGLKPGIALLEHLQESLERPILIVLAPVERKVEPCGRPIIRDFEEL